MAGNEDSNNQASVRYSSRIRTRPKRFTYEEASDSENEAEASTSGAVDKGKKSAPGSNRRRNASEPPSTGQTPEPETQTVPAASRTAAGKRARRQNSLGDAAQSTTGSRRKSTKVATAQPQSALTVTAPSLGHGSVADNSLKEKDEAIRRARETTNRVLGMNEDFKLTIKTLRREVNKGNEYKDKVTRRLHEKGYSPISSASDVEGDSSFKPGSAKNTTSGGGSSSTGPRVRAESSQTNLQQQQQQQQPQVPRRRENASAQNNRQGLHNAVLAAQAVEAQRMQQRQLQFEARQRQVEEQLQLDAQQRMRLPPQRPQQHVQNQPPVQLVDGQGRRHMQYDQQVHGDYHQHVQVPQVADNGGNDGAPPGMLRFQGTPGQIRQFTAYMSRQASANSARGQPPSVYTHPIVQHIEDVIIMAPEQQPQHYRGGNGEYPPNMQYPGQQPYRRG